MAGPFNSARAIIISPAPLRFMKSDIERKVNEWKISLRVLKSNSFEVSHLK